MLNDLVFLDDALPGITRKLIRGKWGYFDVDGARITDRVEIDRLNKIALPPAYGNAWFAPSPAAHVQATGVDTKGRKQYRYHADFRSHHESVKFDGCAAFGRLLPLIRARVDSDLQHKQLSPERAIASIVRLLDTGGIRIGNEAYVKANKSYGATTLRMRHAAIKGSTLKLSFKAKSGKQRELRITDKSLVRFVKRMQDLPGQHLFQYLTSDGTAHPVTSTEVNAYLRETMGQDFTAKHFRTWTASSLAFETLATAATDVDLKTLLARVSGELGNTPAIARKSYVHPAMLALAKDGQSAFRSTVKLPRSTRWLSRYERGLIAYLDQAPAALELIAPPGPLRCRA